jgi:GAF domain-containing protein
VKELQALFGIGKAVTSLHKVETILQRIVEAASYLTGAEEAFLMLVDEDTGELYVRAVQGMGRNYRQFRQKVDDSFAGQVVRTGRSVRMGRGRKGEKHEVVTGHLVRNLLNVPLKVRGKVIGVLGVDSVATKEGFSENDEYLLQALADYAAIAIDNARLYEMMDARTLELVKMVVAQDEGQTGRQPEADSQTEDLAARERQLLEAGEQISGIAQRLSSLCLQLQAVGAELSGEQPSEE